MAKIPAWLKEYVNEARQLLGVGDEWSIYLKMTDRPGGFDDNDGACMPNSVYLNATIEIHNDCRAHGDARNTVYHEVYHVAHSPVDHVVLQLISQIKDEDRGYFEQLYTEAVETYIQRRVRALTGSLKATE